MDNTTYSDLQYSGNFDAVIREQLSSMVDADGASTYFNTTPGFTYTKNCKYPLADVTIPCSSMAGRSRVRTACPTT